MKKIIYSLVIMIAAGSLFTSCIDTTVEPAGVNEMRVAKAEYLRALAELRKADAELQKAHATYVLALAQLEQANVAYRNAETEGKKLENELLALQVELQAEKNEVKKAELAAKIADLLREQELKEEEHKAAMATAEETTANALETLRVTLRDIAAKALTLTDGEIQALANIAKAYDDALLNYNSKAKDLRDAQAALWKAENLDDTVTVEYWEGELDKAIANEALASAAVLAFAALDFSEQDQLAAEVKRYQDSIDHYTYLLKQHDIDGSKLLASHDLCEQIDAFRDSVKKAYNALPKVTAKVDKPYFANYDKANKEYVPVVVPWGVEYKDNAVITKFETYLTHYYSTKIGSTAFNEEGASTVAPLVSANEKGLSIFAHYADIPYIFLGEKAKVSNNGTFEVLNNLGIGGLTGILETLEKEYVINANAAEIAKQIEGQKKTVKDLKDNYDKWLGIIKDGDAAITAKKAQLEKALGQAIDGLYAAWADYKVGVKAAEQASKADSTSLFNAIVNLAKAKANYYGKDDKTAKLTYWDNFGMEYKVALTDLSFNMFVQKKIAASQFRSGYGAKLPYNTTDGTLNKIPQDDANCAFIRVMKVLLGLEDSYAFEYNTSAIQREGTETLTLFSIMKNANGQGKATIPATATYAYDPAKKTHTFGGDFLTTPELEYRTAVCRFWGKEDYEQAFYKDFASKYRVEDFYKANTFEGILFFKGDKPINNNKLNVVLAELAEAGDSKFNDLEAADATYNGIANHFFGSQLFKLFAAEAQLAILENKDSNEAAFEALEAMFLEISAAYVAGVASYESQVAELNAQNAALTAACKALDGTTDASTAKSIIPMSDDALAAWIESMIDVDNGKYIAKGKLNTLLKAIAPKVPGQFKDWTDKAEMLAHIKAHYETFANHIDNLYKDLVSINTKQFPYAVYNETSKKWETKYITLPDKADITAYVEAFDAEVEKIAKELADQLDKANLAVKKAAEDLELFNAGYDAKQLAIEVAKENVTHAIAALEIAKYRLDTIKAEYDAVMAAYAVANIE